MALTDAQSGALILDGSIPVEVTLAGTVAKGDLIGYSTGWKRALATAGSVVQGKAVAGMDGKTGDKIVAYFGKTRIGGRLTAMTAGSAVGRLPYNQQQNVRKESAVSTMAGKRPSARPARRSSSFLWLEQPKPLPSGP